MDMLQLRDQIQHIYRKTVWIQLVQWDHSRGSQHIQLLYTIYADSAYALDDHIRADIVPI